MSNEFLEVNLESNIEYGSSYRESFVVDVTETTSSTEYRVLKVPIPQRFFSISMNLENTDFIADVLDVYHVVHGRYAGFRYKCWDDFTSANDGTSPALASDQIPTRIGAGVYQLVKEYGKSKIELATIGRPKRTIFKPVAGKTRIAIGGVEILNSPAVNWTVNTATGVVTFVNKVHAVSGAITTGTTTTIPCVNHTFLIGEHVVITGVVGMTQINNLRGRITAITAGANITVNIVSNGFSAWASGGTISTQPLVGELVTAGFEFDYPVRFNSDLNVSQVNYSHRIMDSLALKELINL